MLDKKERNIFLFLFLLPSLENHDGRDKEKERREKNWRRKDDDNTDTILQTAIPSYIPQRKGKEVEGHGKE